MPYIREEKRMRHDGILESLKNFPAQDAGELNYIMSVVAGEYLKAKGVNYQTINDVVGALDGAKVEFQRRVVAPYEDKKIEENGDVY